MEEISVLPGRIRLKAPRFYDKDIAQYLDISIEKLEGIRHSSTNFYTSSILIVYDMEKITKDAIKESIWDLLERIKKDKSIASNQGKAYLAAIENRRKSRNRFLFYGSLYLLFRFKNLIIGRFSISSNIRLLVTASVITAIEGYPLLRRFTKNLSNRSSRLSDVFLRAVAISLIFLREDGTGCLLLSLKYMNDYLKYSTDVEYLRMIHQSIADGSEVVRIGDIINVSKGEIISADGKILEGEAVIDGIYSTGQLAALHMSFQDKVYEGMQLLSGDISLEILDLPHKMEKAYQSIEELHIYQEISRYQEGIGTASMVGALISYLITGNLLNAMAIILLLCPTSSELALTTGVNSYLHLLGKHKIFLKDPSVLEKAVHINHVAFDKTGTLTYGRKGNIDISQSKVMEDELRKEAYGVIKGLERQGIEKFSLLTGDTPQKANKTAEKLGIESVYSQCSREEKGKVIQEAKKTDYIMMVGDGINDLKAMEYADVSVGLIHSSCDKVKLYSDCVVFEDDLHKLVDFIELSQKSYRAINHHVCFSKYYNITLGIMAVFVPFSPYTAKYLNTINSLLVLLASKRIEYFQPNNSSLTDSRD